MEWDCVKKKRKNVIVALTQFDIFSNLGKFKLAFPRIVVSLCIHRFILIPISRDQFHFIPKALYRMNDVYMSASWRELEWSSTTHTGMRTGHCRLAPTCMTVLSPIVRYIITFFVFWPRYIIGFAHTVYTNYEWCTFPKFQQSENIVPDSLFVGRGSAQAVSINNINTLVSLSVPLSFTTDARKMLLFC